MLPSCDDGMIAHIDDLALIIAAEQGKPRTERKAHGAHILAGHDPVPLSPAASQRPILAIMGRSGNLPG